MTSRREFDVVIIGGGLAGATLALALARVTQRIAVIEAVSMQAPEQPSYDDRGLVLTLSSQRILQNLHLWEALYEQVNPVLHIHVSDQHHFGFTRLHASDLELPALGYVVIARALGKILLEKIRQTKNIEWICPATTRSLEINHEHAVINLEQDGVLTEIHAKLLVAADGAGSRVSELLGVEQSFKNYRQTAIVSNVTPERPHQNTAYERFSADGPLALLPMTQQRCAVVFTVKSEQAAGIMTLTDEEFLQKLNARFGLRLGRFTRCGKRKHYPLVQSIAAEQVRERLVVMGNAAHTIHPNGAQGFNLCLRDIAGLVEILDPVLTTGKDPGQRRLLNRYVDLRLPDQQRVITFTDILANTFYNNLPHKMFIRNVAMSMFDICPPLKKSFIQRMTGLSGHQPDMVRSTHS